MKKYLILILIVIGGSILFFHNDILDFYLKLTLNLPPSEVKITELVKKAKKQVTTPPPLKAIEEAPKSFLTQSGIIKLTNLEREKYGLPPLKESSALNLSATLKTKDMLAKQYFDHISPSGKSVADLVEMVEYQFISIGENLALGNFENDEALVQGWMNSPGHRANILSLQYQEIGVAVLRGDFAGKTTWLAVQHFGLPLNVCPQPSENILAKITANQAQIKNLDSTLKELLVEIKMFKPKWGSGYNQKIEYYNNLVSQYNNLFNLTQELINQYNNQVILFNDCVSRFQ